MTTPESTPIHDARRLFSISNGRLACGAAVDELLGQAADGRADQLTAHQQGCPHCQAALKEFAQLWAPVQRLADTPVKAPIALRAAVTAQVQKLVADVWYTLQLSDRGSLRVAARVVAAVARDTARTVPGVRVALGRSTHSKWAALVEKATFGHRHPNAAVGVLGRTAVVDLALAVSYGEQVDLIARRVQHDVITELRRSVGLKDVTVNITVDDVLA